MSGIQDAPVMYISDDNDADTISTAGSASYNSLNHSETNVQVAGVDEGDIVETDGHYLYILRGNELLIASSWPADEMSVLSRTALRGQVVAEFLAGDRLTVISEDRVDTHPAVALELDDNVDRDSGADDSLSGLVLFDVSIGDSYSRKEYVTRIRVFDVSDRSAPVMVQDNVVDGNFKDSRAIGDFAYITVDNPSYGYQLPSPKSACTESDDGATRTCISQSKEEYLSWVRESYNEIMAERLPQVRSYDSEGQLVSSGALHDADDLIAFHPDERGELVSLISINMQSDQAGIVSDAGLVATSDSQLYASLGNLYILETAVEYEDGKQTRVTQFNLTAESGEITLAARGAVAGEMVNQFSVDEYQGHLRIATIVTNAGSGNWTNRSENLMWVLKNDNGVLEHVGSVKNLALDQEIKSVRYLADNAFVVTFRDHDPLYALDMSDPVKPVAVGHIAMPGFSSYMQLIDNDRILGVGRNSVNGNDGPLQISLFDVSDLANPKAVDNFTFPHFSSSETEGDHHAFGWFANHNLLAIPTQRTISERVDNNGDGFRETTQSTVFNELAIFRVDSYRGLELVGSVEQDSPLRRTVNVEDKLYAVATDSVKTVDVRSPNQPLDELRLEAPPSEENPEDGNTSEVDPAGGIPATGNPAVGEQNLKSNDGNIAARVWHNEVVSTDVNADGTTSAQDVLVLFNLINDGIYGEMSGVATKAESRLTTGQHYPDVNSDGRLNTADVLYLINRISEKTSSQNTVVASESQTSNKQASYEDVHADPLVEQVESKIEMPATDPDPAAVDKAMDELMGPLQEDQFEELDVNFAGV
ncbi:MAG: inhibitor of cysteine peptidase [Pirellulaceae bacterium]